MTDNLIPNKHKSRFTFNPIPPTIIKAQDGLKCPSCRSANTSALDPNSLYCNECKTGFGMGLYIQVYGFSAVI